MLEKGGGVVFPFIWQVLFYEVKPLVYIFHLSIFDRN